MFESIDNNSTADNTPAISPLEENTGAGTVLDIYRETRPPLPILGKQAKKTAKVTPECSWTDEQKQDYKYARYAETASRSFAAFSIAQAYVNADGIDEEEKSRRLGVVGSFMKCYSSGDGVPLDLLRLGDTLLPLGLWRCNSKWSCPSCASRRLFGDAMRLRRLLEAIAAENADRASLGIGQLSVLFVTLTAPHKPGDRLADNMRVLSSCFSSALHCTSVRKQKNALQFVGSVRCFDHTVHLDGDSRDWHAHLHNIFVFDSQLTDDAPELRDFEDKLYAAWASRIDESYTDGRSCSRAAFDCEIVDLGATAEHSSSALADYAAKVMVLPGYLTKSTRDRGNAPADRFAPFELLDRFIETGEKCFSDAWLDYCENTKGFHRVDFSTGLAARFSLTEEKTPPASARYRLPAPVATAALHDRRLFDGICSAIFSDDAHALPAVLSDYGLGDYASACSASYDVEEKKTEARRSLDRFRATGQ